MDKNEKILLGTACFFAGAVVGFLISPIKKGIYCGNNRNNEEDDNENGTDELDKVLDEVLDEVNETINNATKEGKEEVED